MSDEARYEAYLICKERGHAASGMQAMSNPPWDICKHCGTHYRWTQEIREIRAPRPPS